MNMAQTIIISASIIVGGFALSQAQTPDVGALDVAAAGFESAKGIAVSHAYLVTVDGKAWACAALSRNAQMQSSSCKPKNLP